MGRNIVAESRENFVPLSTVMNEYFISLDAFSLRDKNRKKEFCGVKSIAGVSQDIPWTANGVYTQFTPDGSLTLQSSGWRLNDILESCKALDYEISLNIFPLQLLPV